MKNIDHVYRTEKQNLFLLSDGIRTDAHKYLQSRNCYRVNCLYRATDPEIFDIF